VKIQDSRFYSRCSSLLYFFFFISIGILYFFCHYLFRHSINSRSFGICAGWNSVSL